MAKKQAQSLVGQTDTTLVNAAYRMSMANVPKDISSIHNKIGDSYAAGMKALGAGFGALAGAAINKGVELSKKAKEEKDGTAGESWRNGGEGGFGNKAKGFFGKIGDFVEDVFDGGGLGGKASIDIDDKELKV